MQFLTRKLSDRLCFIPVLIYLNICPGFGNTFNTNSMVSMRMDSVRLPEKFYGWKTDQKFSLTLEFQELYSTHSTMFTGGDFIVAYQNLYPFILGAGMEMSYCRFHDDNSSNLYHLYFAPVFFDNKWRFHTRPKTVFFAHSSEGLSFVNYSKKELWDSKPPYHVFETGFYFYGGAGIYFKTRSFLTPSIELGFKGYHMSLNPWDINPHGITFRFGLTF